MTQMIFYKTDNNKLSLEELLEQLEKNEEEQLIAALKESVLEPMRSWIFLFLIIYCRYLILD